MIELQQLKQLVAISDCGNLTMAAETLFISQPALSRSMQKMESDLGVELFDRMKNKIRLNENGKLAVDFAKKLLTDFDYYIESIKSFDKSRRTISVGVCAPAPMWQLAPKLSAAFPEKNVASEIKDNALLKKGLLDGSYHIIVTDERTVSPDCICEEFCKERLYLCVPHGHKLADKKAAHYTDLDGMTMLLYEQLGTWNRIRDRLKNTRFIVQSDRNAFDDLIKESLLPVFMTNVSAQLFGAPSNRAAIPIDEDDATETFYITVLKKNKFLIDNL